MSNILTARSLRSARGFTLIELMIVVVIVAILAAIALPSYQQHILRSRRTLATTALLDIAARQERFYSTRYTYATSGPDLGLNALPISLQNGGKEYYTIGAFVVNAAVNPPTFTVTATATGEQVNDKECASFTIDSLGQQTATGTANTRCW